MDISQLIGFTIIGFLIVKYLDNYLDIKQFDEYKARLLRVLPFGILGLTFIGQITTLTFITEFMFLWVFLFIIYVIIDLKDQRNVKNIFWLLGPYIVYQVFQIISQSIYGRDEKVAEGFETFFVIWIFAFGGYLNTQNRKEKVRLMADQKEKQTLEDSKKSLEHIVNLRTAEITEQKLALEQSMAELKATQSQLIHSEKMASLGELTAGIAHEIQNPLNFVNNFAELNKELIEELRQEQKKEQRDYENEQQILEDVFNNLEKIMHHGKRADGIIKGMLQHSRKSTGKKEEINLNELADEYLRLAYHGLRAKDKTFNAQMSTNFDSSVGIIMGIHQDIGRVFLNLITNAFYTVNEKKKMLAENNNTHGYEPIVTVSTTRFNNEVIIKISDNGNGMSDAVKDKIFQPFFTTKPTGQGTGLGLSMSYEIITAGHNGEIKVETEEGVGTTFIITIPQ
jgi:two-component system, NtrC family, sensor kinase